MILDEQMLAFFDELRIQYEKARRGFAQLLRERTRGRQQANQEQLAESHRQD